MWAPMPYNLLGGTHVNFDRSWGVCWKGCVRECVAGIFPLKLHKVNNINLYVSLADGGKTRIPRQRLVSNRIVLCLTNVEAFSLRAADLEEVTSLFARFFRRPRVQGAIRLLSSLSSYLFISGFVILPNLFKHFTYGLSNPSNELFKTLFSMHSITERTYINFN